MSNTSNKAVYLEKGGILRKFDSLSDLAANIGCRVSNISKARTKAIKSGFDSFTYKDHMVFISITSEAPTPIIRTVEYTEEKVTGHDRPGSLLRGLCAYRTGVYHGGRV